jgi:dTDP-4-dehydrorhamnose 3,5-epimerase-like enzyme
LRLRPIVDVMVDIYCGSPTFGVWDAFHLDEDNMRSAIVRSLCPKASSLLSDVADVTYKQNNRDADATERGIA